MTRALYFMDDFFQLDFPFGNFSLQFMDGGVWLFDAAQRDRVPAGAFDRCAQSVNMAELRRATCLRAVMPLEIVAELDALRLAENLDLVIASEDRTVLAAARARGIAVRTDLRAYQENVVDRMMSADILFSTMNANGALLEEQVAEKLLGHSVRTWAGDAVVIQRVQSLAIEFGEDENEGFRIFTDKVELDKYFTVVADYAHADGRLVDAGELRVRVRATYRMEGDYGFFTLESITD